MIVSNFGGSRSGTWPITPTRSATFDLAALPDRYQALGFLAGPAIEPGFTEHYLE